MITKRIDLNYKVDPYGTEEILSDESVSLCPVLSIDYGDEVQEAEFTKRPTKGSLDTNINDVAVINAIKGNTIAWNQINNNGDFEDSTGIAGQSASINCQDNVITVVGNGENRWEGFYKTISSFITDHKYYVGISIYTPWIVVVSSSEANIGQTTQNDKWERISGVFTRSTTTNIMVRLRYPQPTSYTFYAKDMVVIDLTQIYGEGHEPSTAPAFEADYYEWFGKHLAYEVYDSGSLRNCKMSGIKTTDADSNLVDIIPIHVASLKGKLNDQGSIVVIFPDGIKRAGSVYDEIKIENNIPKAIKRVVTRAYESGDANGAAMTTDGANYTNYALATPEEYIIDSVYVKGIMLGANEISKVLLGNQIIFEQDN